MRKSIVEEWRDIPEYCGLYQAGNLGYSRVTLSKKGVHHTYYIHRLIAETFIPDQIIKGVKTTRIQAYGYK